MVTLVWGFVMSGLFFFAGGLGSSNIFLTSALIVFLSTLISVALASRTKSSYWLLIPWIIILITLFLGEWLEAIIFKDNF